MTEEWRDIPGYNGAYQASNLGRVQSSKGRQPTLMKLTTTPMGVQLVKLYLHGFGTTFRVSNLVWLAFRGKPVPALFHKDRNQANNSLDNLTTERTI